jgi:hypothetical protein
MNTKYVNKYSITNTQATYRVKKTQLSYAGKSGNFLKTLNFQSSSVSEPYESGWLEWPTCRLLIEQFSHILLTSPSVQPWSNNYLGHIWMELILHLLLQLQDFPAYRTILHIKTTINVHCNKSFSFTMNTNSPGIQTAGSCRLFRHQFIHKSLTTERFGRLMGSFCTQMWETKLDSASQ